MAIYQVDFRGFPNVSLDILKDLRNNVRSEKEEIVSVERIDESSIKIVTKEVKR